MQLEYSDPTTVPREMYSDGSSRTGYTTISNQLIHEALKQQIEHCLAALQAVSFHLVDRTPGMPDRSMLRHVVTSNSASEGYVQSNEDATDLSWLFAAYNSVESEKPSVKNLTNTVQGINELIQKGKFDLLAKILGSAKLSQMSNETMLAFARSSFPVREQIANWKTFVAEVQSELDRREKNSARLLKGLV
ncbi:hypothetical protein [Roseovarius atlanticus]|uniref:hypothetical protein n=1 Tax=Roseovarius atlanticus TaxID=1641875 RepID=UPI000A966051|nr:hypothetical protein [Roseovarius atlanticus]